MAVVAAGVVLVVGSDLLSPPNEKAVVNDDGAGADEPILLGAARFAFVPSCDVSMPATD